MVFTETICQQLYLTPLALELKIFYIQYFNLNERYVDNNRFSAVHFIALRDAKRLFKIPTCDWRDILTHDMFKISPKMTDRGLTDFTRNLSGVTVV